MTALWLLSSDLCSQAAIFTSSTTIAETNLAYEGQDIVISGATISLFPHSALRIPHLLDSLLLTNGAVLTPSPGCAGS